MSEENTWKMSFCDIFKVSPLWGSMSFMDRRTAASIGQRYLDAKILFPMSNTRVCLFLRGVSPFCAPLCVRPLCVSFCVCLYLSLSMFFCLCGRSWRELERPRERESNQDEHRNGIVAGGGVLFISWNSHFAVVCLRPAVTTRMERILLLTRVFLRRPY